MKLSTNIEEVLKTETLLFQQLIDADKVLRKIAFDSVALISKRIQQEGKKSDGSQIGKYSTKVLNFKSITGNFGALATKKQNKKRMKEFGDTDEFYGGYKEFREALGRQAEFVDLTLTGDMMGDFLPIPSGKNEYSVGFRGDKSAEKSGWMEDKYGTIFTPTTEEEDFIYKSLNKKLDAIFK